MGEAALIEKNMPRAAELRQVLRPAKPAEPQLEQMLTVQEACRQLRISRAMLYDFIRKKQLPSVKLGRRRFFRSASIGEFIKRLEAEAEA